MYYGLPVNQDHGLREIEFLWSRRTIDSYVDLKINDIEKTLWRNTRTGVVTQWNKSMISDITKLGGEVIDGYIEISRLPIAAQHRLAIEQINKLQNNIIDLANNLISGKTKGKKGLTKIPEIAAQLSSELKFYPVLRVGELISNAIAQLLEAVEESEITCLLDIVDQSRFGQLNSMAISSQWEDNCLLLTEIAEKKLFRFTHPSFEEYCKSVKISSGSRRVKVGKLIKRFKAADLPLPSNRGQAEIVAEIPIENQIVVWTALLSLDKKITSSLIRDVHKQLLYKQVNQPQLQDSSVLQNKIQSLVNKHGLILDKNIKAFLDSVKGDANPIEIRMIRAALDGLRQQVGKEPDVFASPKTSAALLPFSPFPLFLAKRTAQANSDQELVAC
jgi:hypothetical protein